MAYDVARNICQALETGAGDIWKPWWSPQSEVYNVPVCEPKAAYGRWLTLIHFSAQPEPFLCH